MEVGEDGGWVGFSLMMSWVQSTVDDMRWALSPFLFFHLYAMELLSSFPVFSPPFFHFHSLSISILSSQVCLFPLSLFPINRLKLYPPPSSSAGSLGSLIAFEFSPASLPAFSSQGDYDTRSAVVGEEKGLSLHCLLLSFHICLYEYDVFFFHFNAIELQIGIWRGSS